MSMKTLRNEVNNFYDNAHVQIKMYQEFYHGIIYIAIEGHHNKIIILSLK
jgi:hypothetical protein